MNGLIAAWLVAALSIAAPRAFAGNDINAALKDPQELLERVNRSRCAASWEMTIRLTHAEDRRIDEHLLSVQWAGWLDGAGSLVSVIEPRAFRGTTLLTLETIRASEEDRIWVAFPIPDPVPVAVPPHLRDQSVLGSNFSHRDLERLIAPTDFELSIVDPAARPIVIEGTPRKGQADHPSWSKVRWFIDPVVWDIPRIEYLDETGEVAKRFEVLEWVDLEHFRIPKHQRLTDFRTRGVSDMRLVRFQKVDRFTREDFEIDSLCRRAVRLRNGDEDVSMGRGEGGTR